jgi:hypothetical protein
MAYRPSTARRWPPLRIAQWAAVAALVVTSELVAWSGHTSASYVVDAVAVLAFVAFRRLRRPSVPRR